MTASLPPLSEERQAVLDERRRVLDEMVQRQIAAQQRRAEQAAAPVVVAPVATPAPEVEVEVRGYATMPCADCGKPFEAIASRYCPDCADSRMAAQEQERAAATGRERLKAFLQICPPGYRETDWAKKGLSPECVRLATEWYPGAAQHSLGLYGSTGKGKTRCAFGILRRHALLGWSVYAVHSGDAWDCGEHVQGLSSAARLQYDERKRVADAATSCIARARSAGLLLLDDMGKERASKDGRLSEAVEEALFGLIEYRLANRLPIIWTTNMGAERLRTRLGGDRGEPLLRRLRDVSLCTTIL
ncbi:MAG TPA: hypothetical protein VD994_09150 [Prosthecobacter sp.]|nr:hypothetical protein [Prosthecobacter sp.]